jgi:hypothetical protein
VCVRWRGRGGRDERGTGGEGDLSVGGCLGEQGMLLRWYVHQHKNGCAWVKWRHKQ